MTTIWLAACAMRWPLVQKLLDKGAKNLDSYPPKGSTNQGLTVLRMAAYQKQWPLVEQLLDKGAKNLDADFSKLPTTLLSAARDKQWPLVKRLLDAGAKNLDAHRSEGPDAMKTALFWAIADGSDEAFRHLLAKGASVELAENNYIKLFAIKIQLLSQFTLGGIAVSKTFDNVLMLFELAKKDHEPKLSMEAMQLQLKEVLSGLAPGFAFNGRINGNTALHLAIKNENEPVIEALVLAGADLLLANNEGETAQSLLPDSALVQSFAKLQSLKLELDKFKEKSERKELKEREELIGTIEKCLKELLKKGEKLDKPLQKDTLYYQLGELLHERREQGLASCITAEMVLSVFKKVSENTPELYEKACCQRAEYGKLVPKAEASSVQSAPLDDDQDEDGIERLALAIQAGNQIPGDELYHLLVQGMLGKHAQGREFPSKVREGTALASQPYAKVPRGLGLRQAFRLLHQEFNKKNEELLRLQARIQLLEGAPSSSSSSAVELATGSLSPRETSISQPPIFFSRLTVAPAADSSGNGQEMITKSKRKRDDALSSE